MATLTNTYQLLAESDYYTFLSQYNGKVAIRLYAKINSQDTANNASVVMVKLTRNIIGQYSNVGYRYDSASASLGGTLSHSWSGGSSGGYQYVGEHVVFEKEFWVSHNENGTCALTLSAWYDDTYISERSISAVSFELPTIPRKGEISSVAVSGQGIEEGLVVFYSRPSSNFIYVLEMHAGGQLIFSRQGNLSGAPITLSAAELLALYRALGRGGSITLRLHTVTAQGVGIGRSDYTMASGGLGNIHLRQGGMWRRGLLYVGRSPAVVMVRKNGVWGPAR